MNVHMFRVLSDISMDIYDLMELLGIILRALGAAAFGLGVGWYAVQSLRVKSWELKVATILGLLAAFILMVRWDASPGTLGGYALGVGSGMLIWGVGRLTPKDDDED